MSYLMADAVAHLERNGDIVLTSHGEVILIAFAIAMGLFTIAIVFILVAAIEKATR